MYIKQDKGIWASKYNISGCYKHHPNFFWRRLVLSCKKGCSSVPCLKYLPFNFSSFKCYHTVTQKVFRIHIYIYIQSHMIQMWFLLQLEEIWPQLDYLSFWWVGRALHILVLIILFLTYRWELTWYDFGKGKSNSNRCIDERHKGCKLREPRQLVKVWELWQENFNNPKSNHLWNVGKHAWRIYTIFAMTIRLLYSPEE